MSALAIPSSSSASYFGGTGERIGADPGLRPVQVRDDVAADSHRIGLIDREVVRQSARASVHVRAAEGLLVSVLVDRHLDEWRSAEEDLRGVLLHDDVVAHPGDVRSAAVDDPEHQGDRRNPRSRQLREVLEASAAWNEDVRLLGEVSATGLREVDERQAVDARDLHRSQTLRPDVGPWLPPFTVGSFATTMHSTPWTHPMPVTIPPPRRIIGSPPGERAEFEERGSLVEQEVDAFARQQLVPLAMTGDRCGGCFRILRRRQPSHDPLVRGSRRGRRALPRDSRCTADPCDQSDF